MFNLQLQCNQPTHRTQETSGEKNPSNPQNRSFFYLVEIPQLPANFAHFLSLARTSEHIWLLPVANHLIRLVLFESGIDGYIH